MADTPFNPSASSSFSTDVPALPSNPSAVTQNNPNFSTNGKPSPFNIPSFVQPYDFQGDRNASNTLINNYSGFINAQETLPQMYDRLSNQLQLPAQRQNVQAYNEQAGNLTAAIEGMPTQVANTTQNSLVTEGQRAGLVQNKLIPLQLASNQVGRLGQQASANLNMSEQELGNRMNMAQQQEQKQLLPWEQQFSEMDQQQARQLTGWTTANQLELTRLTTNAMNGEKWTTEEADRANKLALAEWSYRTALDSIKEQGNQNRQTNAANLPAMYSAFHA